MKAYKVSCRDDDHGCEVHFADTSNAARQLGNGDMCDCPYVKRRAVRAPELDQYAPGPVSLLTLFLNHEWFVFCRNCETPVYSDRPGHVVEGEEVFCGKGCQRKWRKFWAKDGTHKSSAV